MKSPLSRLMPAFLFVLFALMVDAIIKFVVERSMALYQNIDILPFLALFKTYNPGIAFSMFSDTNGWLLVGLRLCIVLVVLYLWRKTDSRHFWAQLGFALVVAGALGNILDHFLYGHVVDYVRFHIGAWTFPIFNLADSYITVGAVLIFIQEFILNGLSSDEKTSEDR